MIKRLFKLMALLIVLSSFVAGWYWHEYNTFLSTPVSLTSPQSFTIEKGETVNQIAESLKQQNIIKHPDYFRLYTRLSKQAAKIKAGEYTLKNGMTAPDIVKVFVDGKVNLYSLTIVEGQTVKENLLKIQQDPNLIQTLDNIDQEELKKILNSEHETLEGLLYPDTYKFPRGTTDIEFIRRAYLSMQKILADEWQQREKDLPINTPYDALILASIVEKESGVSSERSKIAGVFIRRIKKKMRLQSDPTIIYGMGERYKGNIRKRDINEKTPYNTYQIDGLPPTPIAIAGREAIHAVLHPDKGKSLYFVADGSGGHHFSNSLKAHNKAVRKYILKKK